MAAAVWQSAHCHKYFGGVTRIIQCDNLKTGVQKHGKDEAVLNKSYQDLALLIKHTTTYKGVRNFEDYLRILLGMPPTSCASVLHSGLPRSRHVRNASRSR